LIVEFNVAKRGGLLQAGVLIEHCVVIHAVGSSNEPKNLFWITLRPFLSRKVLPRSIFQYGYGGTSHGAGWCGD